MIRRKQIPKDNFDYLNQKVYFMHNNKIENGFIDRVKYKHTGLILIDIRCITCIVKDFNIQYAYDSVKELIEDSKNN